MKKLIPALLFLSAFAGFSQINNDHLKVGEIAPEIKGTDQFGKNIDSENILKEQKILLLFYRGNWCPYCKKHLKKLSENLETLTKKGYYVVVVTPEKTEKTKETSDKVKAKYSIIHDKENKIMDAYKVTFEVTDKNVTSYYGFTKNKVASYNETNNNVLPVPATYIISKDGKISFVHYDPDYSKRASIDELINM
ncbi:MAG: peroxiredoxin-like family protein [Flavobacteriaceae bacterium]|nr:peroxiredoxin-like family protein [Flavobacteriaceae bacterium]